MLKKKQKKKKKKQKKNKKNLKIKPRIMTMKEKHTHHL